MSLASSNIIFTSSDSVPAFFSDIASTSFLDIASYTSLGITFTVSLPP
ncbi:7949_t:CDS:1, partial [Dentiscutata erythropus]